MSVCNAYTAIFVFVLVQDWMHVSSLWMPMMYQRRGSSCKIKKIIGFPTRQVQNNGFHSSNTYRPVRLAYQPPASSTFLSQQTSHQQPASSTPLSEQTSTSHQPSANRTGS
jgi:hypothetical protein